LRRYVGAIFPARVLASETGNKLVANCHPDPASHPRRGWEAERRDLRVPQVSGFSRPGFRHEAQLPPEKKLRTENRQLTTAFLKIACHSRRAAQPIAPFAKTRAFSDGRKLELRRTLWNKRLRTLAAKWRTNAAHGASRCGKTMIQAGLGKGPTSVGPPSR
jgi:hypothetical protein